MPTITLTQPGHYVYTLDRAGSELQIRGAFWLAGNENFSLNLELIHAAPHTTARVDLRAVVDGHARASIKGTILVKKSAPQTDSFLSEKILLLSKSATAAAIPNLEILNDEVKCSHAATVGTIDEEQLFYLTSRGISPTKAKNLIAKGFLKV